MNPREDLRDLTREEKARRERDRICRRLYEDVRETYGAEVSDYQLEGGLRFWASAGGLVTPDELVGWWRRNRASL